MSRISLVLCVSILTGCLAPSGIPKGYEGPIAVVWDSMDKISNTEVYFYAVSSVNGIKVETSSSRTAARNYGRGFSMDAEPTTHYIPAEQPVTLVLTGASHHAAPILSLRGGMPKVHGEITFTPKKNRIYQVKGSTTKDESKIWLIKESTGEVISEVYISKKSNK